MEELKCTWNFYEIAARQIIKNDIKNELLLKISNVINLDKSFEYLPFEVTNDLRIAPNSYALIVINWIRRIIRAPLETRLVHCMYTYAAQMYILNSIR